MRFIQQAIEVEARRQIAILEAGGKVEQETRLYDLIRVNTIYAIKRGNDYRYFPDPDLLPPKLIKIGLKTFDPVCQNSLTKEVTFYK